MVRRRDARLAQMVAPAPSSIDTGTLAASLGTAGIDAEPLRELL